MSFYLYLNTGSVNHGCEAIARSTCKILDETCGKQKKILASSNVEQDKRFHLDNLAEIVPAGIWRNQFQRGFYYLMRKATRKSELGIKALYKEFLGKIHNEDVAFCIGGDTYCYEYPEYLEVCLEDIKKRGAKAILWGASIEPSAMSQRLLCHLSSYDYIVVREGITSRALLEKGIASEKVLKACDPAFHLPMEETLLPYGFMEKNTIGLNISGFVAGEETPKTEKVFETVRTWLQDLLQSTEYHVCLIPHVYGKGAFGKDDLYYTEKLYNELPDDLKPRISMVREELSCVQLKYIISKCRFFVGARTHSMIAAYSAEVPAIALGYSVKADGIATDLFGTTDNFVLNIEKLQKAENLKAAFAYLVANEAEIKKQYARKIPLYKELILTAAKEILSDKEHTI